VKALYLGVATLSAVPDLDLAAVARRDTPNGLPSRFPTSDEGGFREVGEAWRVLA
jgi:hypothetical protein